LIGFLYFSVDLFLELEGIFVLGFDSYLLIALRHNYSYNSFNSVYVSNDFETLGIFEISSIVKGILF